jgi:hypothetical protein
LNMSDGFFRLGVDAAFDVITDPLSFLKLGSIKLHTSSKRVAVLVLLFCV